MEIKSRTKLIELMRHLGLPLVGAEIGVAEGIFSTELLSLGIEKLYLIDVWEKVPFIDGCASFEQDWHDSNYESVLERIKGHEDKVILMKGFSYKMAEQIQDESLGLAYIDGDHTRLGVKADIHAFWPKLVSGGIMAFHDYGNPTYGVFDAVENFKQENGLHVFELPEDGDRVNLGCYLIKR